MKGALERIYALEILWTRGSINDSRRYFCYWFIQTNKIAMNGTWYLDAETLFH